jgi:hypothetical protein
VNCNQELCIELWSVINFHCEIEPSKFVTIYIYIYEARHDVTHHSAFQSGVFRVNGQYPTRGGKKEKQEKGGL